ncbi:hypothetical protein [Streptomyces sp. NPDC006510]|uniref:hypothetical protein n=1 Tax=Streptomyces sp. NPDC006510 TaxID=3155600 RepID=UPI0033B308B3
MDASLEHCTATMVTTLFDQAERRDPERLRHWNVLVDGANHQLECLAQEAARRGVSMTSSSISFMRSNRHYPTPPCQ